jgi:hypothetical protein
MHAFSRVLLVLCVLAAGSAHASSYLEIYREKHPDWKPEFPKTGLSLEETVASIYLSHDLEHRTLTEVESLRILEAAPERREVSQSDLEISANAWAGNYVVLAKVACDSPNSDPFVVYSAWRTSWYALREGRLVSWSHSRFTTGCRVTVAVETGADFAALRSNIVETLSRALEAKTVEELVPPAPGAGSAPNSVSEDCAGLSGYVSALRDAIVAARTIARRAMFADAITATLHLAENGSLSVEKLRPVEGGPARLVIQDVRKVSGSPDRPVPPSCALGKTFDVEIAR